MKGPARLFSEVGATFLTTPEIIHEKYSKIQAFIFDWDGVFNSGMKSGKEGSLYAEPDAMGTNLLRFNHYLLRKHMLRTFMITGVNNPSALDFAKRENFNAIFLNYKHKEEALEIIRKKFDCKPDRIAFVFDDVLDLGMAKLCSLGFFVKRKASILTEKYVRENECCDYITANEGNEHAVREICEMLIGLTGQFNKTIERRIQFEGPFREYFEARQKITTQVFRKQ